MTLAFGPGGFGCATRGGVAMRSWPLLLPAFSLLLLTHFGRFSSFHSQRSVMAAWATPSPWSINISSQYAKVIPLP